MFRVRTARARLDALGAVRSIIIDGGKERPQSHFSSNFTCRRIAHLRKGSIKTQQADRSRPTKKQDQES